MASYDDLGAVSYWKALEVPEDQKRDAKRALARILTTRKVDSSRKDRPHLSDHINEIDEALADEHGFYMAPSEMVRHAQQYLRYLHFNQPIPDPMPQPRGEPGEFLAAYKDWGHDPYGGGWNFWAPGIDVKDIMQKIRHPFQGAALYIVGEAYSGSQGWVEGALTTTERVMREHLNLRPASWHSENIYLGY